MANFWALVLVTNLNVLLIYFVLKIDPATPILTVQADGITVSETTFSYTYYDALNDMYVHEDQSPLTSAPITRT